MQSIDSSVPTVRPLRLQTTASTVEVTIVWGSGRDACAVETKQFKAGSKIVLGESGDFVLPIDRVELDVIEQNPIQLGAFTVFMRGVEENKELAPSMVETIFGGAMPQIGGSALAHGLLVAAFAFFMPALGAADEDGVARDQILQMKALLNAAAEQDVEPPPADDKAADMQTSDHSGGKKAEGKEGQMGKNDVQSTKNAMWTAAGDAKPEDAQLARERLRREAMDFGMIGLLNMGAPSDPNAPAVPWGSQLNGSDPISHAGNLWAGDPGDVFGWGGLNLSGTGDGGGCHGADCKGIGLNDVGGLGKSLDNRIGSGTCMVGPCNGHGSAIVGGGHKPVGPSMRQPLDFQAGGRIPKDVIQREVRLHAGQMRGCYEDGLRTNPSLQGRVEVKFVIGRDGSITIAQDTANSDLPNPAVRACVVKQFYNLSFANPGGTVQVTYPLTFVPSE
jgi:hypothetical protein